MPTCQALCCGGRQPDHAAPLHASEFTSFPFLGNRASGKSSIFHQHALHGLASAADATAQEQRRRCLPQGLGLAHLASQPYASQCSPTDKGRGGGKLGSAVRLDSARLGRVLWLASSRPGTVPGTAGHGQAPSSRARPRRQRAGSLVLSWLAVPARQRLGPRP